MRRYKSYSSCPQKLIDKLDGDLEYALRTDGKMAPEDCENYAEVGGAGWSWQVGGQDRSAT